MPVSGVSVWEVVLVAGYWILAAGRPRDKQPGTSDQRPEASGQRPDVGGKKN